MTALVWESFRCGAMRCTSTTPSHWRGCNETPVSAVPEILWAWCSTVQQPAVLQCQQTPLQCCDHGHTEDGGLEQQHIVKHDQNSPPLPNQEHDHLDHRDHHGESVDVWVALSGKW